MVVVGVPRQGVLGPMVVGVNLVPKPGHHMQGTVPPCQRHKDRSSRGLIGFGWPISRDYSWNTPTVVLLKGPFGERSPSNPGAVDPTAFVPGYSGA